jgi:SHS2 domain-containing protein
MTMPPFEEIDHTADRAFRVRALSRADLFKEASEALYALGGVKVKQEAGDTRTADLQAEDAEGLLILWLNELLFLLEHDQIALRDIRIEELTGTRLRASGQSAEVTGTGKYIKAATYSGLRIVETDGVWQATVVLDV